MSLLQKVKADANVIVTALAPLVTDNAELSAALRTAKTNIDRERNMMSAVAALRTIATKTGRADLAEKASRL